MIVLHCRMSYATFLVQGLPFEQSAPGSKGWSFLPSQASDSRNRERTTDRVKVKVKVKDQDAVGVILETNKPLYMC